MSVNRCIEKIPKTIKNLLNCKEKVLFRGSFDVTTINKTENIITNNADICKNKNGYNIYTQNFNYVNASPLGSPTFLYVSFIFSSYNTDLTKQKGVISFNNLLVNSGSGGISVPGIYLFPVSAANGIYEGVKSVIIDSLLPIRQLYFCG